MSDQTDGSAEGSEKPFGSDFPRIVESTNGREYALSNAWVTYLGMKFVLAFEIYPVGGVSQNDYWCTEEILGADGTPSRYSDTNLESLPLMPDQDRIWTRLEAILANEALSGPLDAE